MSTKKTKTNSQPPMSVEQEYSLDAANGLCEAVYLKPGGSLQDVIAEIDDNLRYHRMEQKWHGQLARTLKRFRRAVSALEVK